MFSQLDHNRLTILLGPVIGISAALISLQLNITQTDSALTLGITVWIVTWWVFETIPIPVTSLLALALFPLAGILGPSDIARAVGDPIILFLMGGFILATALEKNNVHQRIALTMVNLFGGQSSRRLVYGFMLASAFLSMWISITATSLMLLPVAMAVISKSKDPQLATPLLIGIAYAASIGGVATPIGTPSNLAFMTIYSSTFDENISFFEWMTWGLPVTLLMLPITALWITRTLKHSDSLDLPKIGVWSAAEKRVLLIFALTVLLWVTRKGPWGGWTELLNLEYANDAMVAFLGIVCLFIIPNGRGEKLLDWESASQIPWGTLILFGAGLSIAQAFVSSGLSSIIGGALEDLALLPLFTIIFLICLCVTFLTEVTSNTATTTLLMPILAAAAIGASIDPKLLMIPAAMSASCAFMLPVATPPNIVVFSTGMFPASKLVSEGFAMNLTGIVIISMTCYFIIG